LTQITAIWTEKRKKNAIFLTQKIDEIAENQDNKNLTMIYQPVLRLLNLQLQRHRCSRLERFSK
jgi:hypothetical protein